MRPARRGGHRIRNHTMNQVEKRPIRVLLVDDHRAILWGLSCLIDCEAPRMAVVGTAVAGGEALAALETTNPDVIVLDVDLGGENGLDLMPELRRRSDARIIIFTGLADCRTDQQALHDGAWCVLRKDGPATAIIEAIEKAGSGQPANAASPASRSAPN